jgi:hypothetical protein
MESSHNELRATNHEQHFLSEDDHLHPQVELGRALLARLLGEGGGPDDLSPPLQPTQMRAVREVARRLSGQPFSLNPVTVELVKAALIEWIGPGAARSEPEPGPGWLDIADRIAATLYDDPVTHDRLAALWARLGKS